MILFVITFLAIISVNNFTYAIDGPQIISSVVIEGNEIISDEEILSMIEIEAGDPLDEEKLKSDLQRVYDLGYFQDVSISFQVYQGGLKAIFEIIEYPLVKEIIIEGNVTYSDEKFLSLLGIKEGELLDHSQLMKGRRDIEILYQNDGYMLARFSDINISDEGTLTLEFNEGYINDIIINGNEKTKDFVILRELEFSKGDILNMEKLQKSFQKLARLNLFMEFNPRLERVNTQDNTANIIIDLVEAKTGNLGTGVTYSTKDGWYGFIDISERNFLGNGQTIGFDWKFGGVTNYGISFHEPWLMGTPTSFGINLYDRTSTGKEEDVEYTEKRRGGSISLGHKIIDDWNGRIRFRLEDSSLNWDKDENKNGERLIDEKSNVRSLTLQANRDTTNHPFNPTRGSIDLFSIEYAGQMLGGDEDFTKYNADMRRFYPGFKYGHAWGLRLKAGTSEGELPRLEEYRLGGSESLRGYENGDFNGSDMLLLNLEYRFPIVENFTGVLFTDAGNAWGKEDKIDLSDLNYSYGAGLRMNTPIGQIRLDYGFNDQGEGQPHLSIGHTF